MLLQREGQTVNYKRIERFYREQVLAVRRRKRKRLVRSTSATAPTLERAHHQWSLGFVSKTTVQACVLLLLTVIDVYTWEFLAIETDTSLSGRRVTAALGKVLER